MAKNRQVAGALTVAVLIAGWVPAHAEAPGGRAGRREDTRRQIARVETALAAAEQPPREEAPPLVQVSLDLARRQLEMARKVLDRNQATGTFENGFTVDGDGGANADNTLVLNKTSLDAGQGFAVIDGAANTVLMSNTATKNRVGFCDEGVGTVTAGNAFGPTAVSCPIAHGPIDH